MISVDYPLSGQTIILLLSLRDAEDGGDGQLSGKLDCWCFSVQIRLVSIKGQTIHFDVRDVEKDGNWSSV